MEVAIGEYGPVLDSLIIPSICPKEEKEKEEHGGFSLTNFTLEEIKEGIKRRKIFKVEKHSTYYLPQPNTFFMEFYYLYMRNLIILQRNYVRLSVV